VEATYLIERLTDAGELVLDPMCGSGVVLATARQLGRRFFGVEIDPARQRREEGGERCRPSVENTTLRTAWCGRRVTWPQTAAGRPTSA
jgi:hypothetical protein